MCPPFLVRMKLVPQSKLPSRTLLQHPPIHSCGCSYAFGRESLEKFRKETAHAQTDRQLMLLATSITIRLHAPMRLICFFDITKAERRIALSCHLWQPWGWSVSDFIFLASAYEGGRQFSPPHRLIFPLTACGQCTHHS